MKLVGRCLILLVLLSGLSCAHVEVSPMTRFSPGTKFYYAPDKYINYKIFGSGPINLIFLHGFAASLETWTDILPFFATDKFKIYLIDLKGAGFSSVPRDPDYSIKANAIIVSEFIKQNKIRKSIIVGHSFGGGVALLTTLLLAENSTYFPSGLILIDAAAYKIDLPFFVSYARIPILNRIILGLTSAQYKAKYTLEKIYFDKKKITSAKINRYAFFLQGPDYAYALIETASDVIPSDLKSYISKYKEILLPSLIIWGENDKVIPIGFGHMLNNDLSNSKLEILKECGHNPQEELPDKIAELIHPFIYSIQR